MILVYKSRAAPSTPRSCVAELGVESWGKRPRVLFFHSIMKDNEEKWTYVSLRRENKDSKELLRRPEKSLAL